MLIVFDYKTLLGALVLNSVEELLLAAIVEVAVTTGMVPNLLLSTCRGAFRFHGARICLLYSDCC